MKNVTLVDDFSTILQLSLADITYAIETYVLDKLELPTRSGRKIYISRNNNVESDSAFVSPGDPTSGYTANGTRLFSESVLEKYLVSEGFEIVNVTLLDSIEEQVKLMNSASVLLGVTGTGLTNCLFLNTGSMVIELKVEILWPSGDHDANDHYFKLSYGKGHYYVSLDVSDKQGATAVKKLKTLFKALDTNNL
jgi:capsular polysaccharide biosynthesis protein